MVVLCEPRLGRSLVVNRAKERVAVSTVTKISGLSAWVWPGVVKP